MTRSYLPDEANARLRELEPILSALRAQRGELIRLRDIVLEAGGDSAASGESSGTWGGGESSGTLGGRAERGAASQPDLRLVRLRMQGLIDQMQAGVARIDELDVVLRDIGTGLIDFPALVNSRQVWLCWRLGEDQIAWWHELTTGVAGRRPIIDLD